MPKGSMSRARPTKSRIERGQAKGRFFAADRDRKRASEIKNNSKKGTKKGTVSARRKNK